MRRPQFVSTIDGLLQASQLLIDLRLSLEPIRPALRLRSYWPPVVPCPRLPVNERSRSATTNEEPGDATGPKGEERARSRAQSDRILTAFVREPLFKGAPKIPHNEPWPCRHRKAEGMSRE